ncbi:uncharacterized protein LOC126879249 isoform X2 [Diabrotica virgifera virgifera]|uniref:DDE-1 domain-containing protein n=1 Tax=Diabrotica virgifera virgifera TaxID=50390 RepID=A0ABM5JK02_DIAVI|nr:uncharacterized protein LOC126879249 isoform X2 [Diabrotica virgifera virgifera]
MKSLRFKLLFTILRVDSASETLQFAFIERLDHFCRFKNPGPAFLIFDGASSHLNIRIVEAAMKKYVTLFCLLSNTAHELQPLDKAVFRSFESYWDEEVLNFLDWNTPLTNYCDNELIKTNKEFHIVSINADCSTIPCQSDNIARKLTNAEYCKEYCQRIKNNGIPAVSRGRSSKGEAKTTAQRSKEYRARLKIKKSLESTSNSHTDEVPRKNIKSGAQRSKEYRDRKKIRKLLESISNSHMDAVPRKITKTAAQRGKEYRERKKMRKLLESTPNSHIDEVPSTMELAQYLLERQQEESNRRRGEQTGQIPQAISSSLQSSSPHTQNQRLYYERHKEEINRYRREGSIEDKNLKPLPASAAERMRKYRERHKEEINRRKREERLNNQNLKPPPATAAERMRRYRERHKEELNNRKKEERLKNKNPKSLPATAAERNRKYRERNKQEINKKRRNSRRINKELNSQHKEKIKVTGQNAEAASTDQKS